MSRLRGWPARFPTGSRPNMKRYPLKAAETFGYGDFVKLTSGEVEVCGADPSAILGLSAQSAADVVEAGYIIVWIADGDTEFALQAIDSGDSNAEVAADEDEIGSSYGVTAVNGVWCLDVNKTAGDARVIITGADENRDLYFVKVLAANRQLGA